VMIVGVCLGDITEKKPGQTIASVVQEKGVKILGLICASSPKTRAPVFSCVPPPPHLLLVAVAR